MNETDQAAYLLATGWQLVEGFRYRWRDPVRPNCFEVLPNAVEVQQARERYAAKSDALLAALLPVVKAALELAQMMEEESDPPSCQCFSCRVKRAVRALTPEQRAEIERRAGK
jgi:hypothetical protein